MQQQRRVPDLVQEKSAFIVDPSTNYFAEDEGMIDFEFEELKQISQSTKVNLNDG